jgi:hypothetical protein
MFFMRMRNSLHSSISLIHSYYKIFLIYSLILKYKYLYLHHQILIYLVKRKTMSSTSETGHAKNVANFEDLIDHLEILNPPYNPSKPILQLSALKTQLPPAQAAIKKMSVTAPPYQSAVDAQEALFSPFSKMLTRIMNIFRSSVENPEEVRSAESLAKLMKGSSKSAEKAEEETAEESKNSRSTSRRSYDSILENFEKFIDILIANPLYKPNEAEFSTQTLSALLVDMKVKNKAVGVLEGPLRDARKERNLLLYTPGTGIVDVGNAVRTHIKGTLKKDNPHYKAILAIEFKAR